MHRARRVRRAYRRGGAREVYLASRRWLARLVYPGEIPRPPRKRDEAP
ncbi:MULTISPECIES: hypothetical protein [Mumia]|uniref:Uncharacterized protein n=1 Tax=Mumia xiangluensis TaxID=1678900 RepID=A0ABW1QSC1_9ACTN|nr:MULTISPECIES: hypothetical protein [Mumia]